jgi:hypothetical protein
MKDTLKLSGNIREIPILQRDEPYCRELDEDGKHDWRYVGTAKDGTTFYKCRCCGIESEGM